jgi:hypothetical protein
MFGIEINFKDGSKDWIDPVYELPLESDEKLYVEGGNSQTYDYDLKLVDKWFKYELCNECEHDKRTYDCDAECMKP